MKDEAENVEFYRIYNGQGPVRQIVEHFEKKCPLSYFVFGLGGWGECMNTSVPPNTT